MKKTRDQIKTGIHFGMSDDDYHADDALGSTTLRQILASPGDYWWNSPMNPARPKDKETDAELRGKAMHVCTLESRETFERQYFRRPDDDDDATPADKSAITKAAKKDAAAQGKAMLHGEVYDRTVLTSAMITRNPDFAEAFGGGIPEVSVFWEQDGVRMKVRLDYLKVRATTDLKTITNPLKIDFVQACRNEMRYRKMPMQARHYLNGRAQIARLLADGAVYGDHDAALFKRIAASKEYAFVFVFYQAEGAPLTWGRIYSPGNPLLDIAQIQLRTAIEKYKTAQQTFGTDMWLPREPLGEADQDEDFRGRYGME